MIKFPNGTIVKISSVYKTIGQICDCSETFMGRSYAIYVLECDLFEKGEVINAFEEFLIKIDNYKCNSL